MPEVSLEEKTEDLMRASIVAIDYLNQEKRKLFIPKSFFLMLHKLLLAHKPEDAGRYRDARDILEVSQATFIPSEPARIVDQLVELQDFINNRRKWRHQFNRDIKSKIDLSDFPKEVVGMMYGLYIPWYVHHRLVVIHPFSDGNGRISRLIMCVLLRENGLVEMSFPPLINTIINENKTQYLDALNAMDGDNQPRAFLYVMRLMKAAYQKAAEENLD